MTVPGRSLSTIETCSLRQVAGNTGSACSRGRLGMIRCRRRPGSSSRMTFDLPAKAGASFVQKRRKSVRAGAYRRASRRELKVSAPLAASARRADRSASAP